jgi:hypothetical protein
MQTQQLRHFGIAFPVVTSPGHDMKLPAGARQLKRD